MDWLYSTLLTVHVTAGFSSLALFLVPVFTKKGSDWHVRTGKIYIAFMWVVVGTAFILSLINFWNGRYFTAAFLGFLSVLTSHPLWFGIVVLKYKKALPAKVLFRKKLLEGFIFILALLNIGVFVYLKGQGQSILLLIFGILGLFAGSAVFRSSKKPADNTQRIGDHIASMVISGIAAYTAFLAFGGYTFFSSLYDGIAVVFFWTLPGIIGSLIIARFRKRYAA